MVAVTNKAVNVHRRRVDKFVGGAKPPANYAYMNVEASTIQHAIESGTIQDSSDGGMAAPASTEAMAAAPASTEAMAASASTETMSTDKGC